jgi:hypothetical protein
MIGTLNRRLDRIRRRRSGLNHHGGANASVTSTLTDEQLDVVWGRVFGDSVPDRELTDDEGLDLFAALYEFMTGKDAPFWDENGQPQSQERWFLHDRDSCQVIDPRSGERVCATPFGANLLP